MTAQEGDTVPEPFYAEVPLVSGATAQLWVSEHCAVIKANGLVTYASRQNALDSTPERLAELAPLLLAAALPSTPRWRPADA